MISIKYYIQKLLGRLMDAPVFPEGKTVGYSLVRSELADCSLGRNTRVHPPFFLHRVTLGDYSYIAKNAQITNCEIGKFCSIGPNCCCGMGIHPTNGISTSPMFYSAAKQNGITFCLENRIEESKKTVVGNDVFIGANVTILDGVRIGDGVIVGAGAVVTKDIPPYAIVSGVPAIVKRFRFDAETIDKLIRKEWWNGPMEELIKVRDHFDSVQEFLTAEQ